MGEKSTTHHKGKNKIDAIKKIHKQQESQNQKDKYIRNESNKGMSLDKSRASQINETEDRVK